MDKTKKSKEKQKILGNKLKTSQTSIKKDYINCNNTIQNTNPNININISIKNNKFKSISNRVKSAHYTINSKPLNNSAKKNINNYNYNYNINNNYNYNTNFNTRSLRARSNRNKNSLSNQKIQSAKPGEKYNNLNYNNLNRGRYNKNNFLLRKMIENKYQQKPSLFEQDPEIMSEYENLKYLWSELGITDNFIRNFELMNNNRNNNRDDILQIILTEKKQMVKFKSELMRVIREIEKREDEIRALKRLEQKYSNLRIYHNFENESDVKEQLKNKDLISREELEKNIHTTLQSLRLKGINTVNQIKKFKMNYSYLMNIGKIDSNVLYEGFGYDKDYLIKLINDLDFLKDSTLKEMYYFSPKGEDPFLLSLTGKKDLLSNYKNRDKESEYEHEFENYMNNIENGNKRYNNYLNGSNNESYDHDEFSDGKKYKVLPISKELLGVVKNLSYYLNQEMLFHMTKLGDQRIDSANNVIESSIKELDNNIPDDFDKNYNITIGYEVKRNVLNRSRAIAKLKNNKNEYDKLFFNKTHVSKNLENDKFYKLRKEKLNISSNKKPLIIKKDYIISEDKNKSKSKDKIVPNKGDNNVENKEDADKENNIETKSIETNLIHKAKIENILRRKEDRPSSKDEESMKPKLQTNKEIKKLIIRAKDNFSSNKDDSAKTTLLKREEDIYNEVEKRVKIEVDKKMKEIEDGVHRQVLYTLEEDRKRLEEEAKIIEEEKKRIKLYHEQQELRRAAEEQKRIKDEEEQKLKDEREKQEKIEKEKRDKENDEKMKIEIIQRVQSEINKKFKEQEEIQKKKEMEEKKRREEEEKERKKREAEERKRIEKEKKNLEKLILESNRYEKERILKEERDRIANDVVEGYKIEQIYTLQKEEKDLKKIREIDKEYEEKEKLRQEEKKKQEKKNGRKSRR